MRKITNIVLHWLGPGSSHNFIGQSAVDRIRRWHKQKGWRDIGYHYLIDRNGDEFDGRSDRYSGAHCIPRNGDSIGVNLMFGTEDSELTPAAFEATARLLRELSEFYKFPLTSKTVTGHNDWWATSCPGFIKDLIPSLIQAAVTGVNPTPDDPGETDQNRSLKVFLNNGKVRAFHNGMEEPASEGKWHMHDGKFGLTIMKRKVEPLWCNIQLGYKKL